MKLVSTVVAALFVGVQAQEVIVSKYDGSEGLNDAAKTAGKYMGTATDHVCPDSPAYDTAYMLELYNSTDWGMISPDQVMTPSYLQWNKGIYTFESADYFLDWAHGRGYQARCRFLISHIGNPPWISESMDNKAMLKALTYHITYVMSHFGDSCYSWDVVDGAVGDDATYRKSLWYNKLGESYIAQAFKVANQVKEKYDLKVKLYYNDYGIEHEGSEKTKFAQNMVKNLLSQGIKIDGVGLASHFTVGQTPSKEALMNVMKFYTDLGLDVALTELDISVPPPASMDQQLQQIKEYEGVIAACKATAKCVSASVWEFIDSYSPTNASLALPYYQPNGVRTPMVRKGVYDGIMNGWKA